MNISILQKGIFIGALFGGIGAYLSINNVNVMKNTPPHAQLLSTINTYHIYCVNCGMLFLR
jgi:hypothetical protein